MKLHKAIIVFSCSLSANAADWTSQFKHLENEQTIGNGKTLELIMDNIFIYDKYTKNSQLKKEVLSINAKTGNFNIPQPYKSDILPAKFFKYGETGIAATIPLKNATLYGKKLKSFTYWESCGECSDLGFTADFGPMNESQFRQLKNKIQFPYIQNEVCGSGPSANLLREENKVHLAINLSC